MSHRREEGTWPVPATTVEVPTLGSVALRQPGRRSRAVAPLEGWEGAGEPEPRLRQQRSAVYRLHRRKAEPSGDGCAVAVKGASVWKGEYLPLPGVWID